jgi:glycosyltransferase involved in cell wall biosynthesis
MQADSLICEDLPVARRRLHVSLVTETYPPEINGVAMTLGKLVEGLLARDHPVQLIRPRQACEATSDAGSGMEQVLRPGIPIPRYPGLTVGLPAKRLLTRLWAARRPDIVHIATEGPLGWSALAAAEKLRLPVVSGFHTNFDRYSRHYGIGWLKNPIQAYLRKFHNRACLTLVPTRSLQTELLQDGFRGVEVLARGVDPELFDPARGSDALRREWGVQDGGLAVIHVGRVAPEKNLELLVDSFRAIESRHPGARLIMVGDGPALTPMKRAHPDILFRGSRVGEDLATHYASADIFLFPSTTETFGNTLTEAMASGLACVAFDYAAAAEHVRHGHDGLKAPYLDARVFTDLAVHMATRPEARQAMRRAARETALDLSWASIHERLEEHYLRVLGTHEATLGASQTRPTKSW